MNNSVANWICTLLDTTACQRMQQQTRHQFWRFEQDTGHSYVQKHFACQTNSLKWGENARDDKKTVIECWSLSLCLATRQKLAWQTQKKTKAATKRRKKLNGWECKIKWAKILKTNKEYFNVCRAQKSYIKLSATGVQRLGQSEEKRT